MATCKRRRGQPARWDTPEAGGRLAWQRHASGVQKCFFVAFVGFCCLRAQDSLVL